jgi:DNA polymerase III subunit delta
VTKGSKDWAQQLKGALKGVGLLLRLSAKDVQADRYAQDCATALGKTLSAPNARLLVEVVGDDLARLGQEVEKLSLYVGDAAEIGADDIHAATALLAQAVIWDLTSAIASGNTDLAIESMHRLQEGGDDPRRLLSMIAWQARDLCRMDARVRAGLSDAQIRAQVRMQPDAFKHARARMARGGFPHAAKLMGRLADANRAMNSHRAGAERILEELVLDLVAS